VLKFGGGESKERHFVDIFTRMRGNLHFVSKVVRGHKILCVSDIIKEFCWWQSLMYQNVLT
jgi:hypothetical protein